MTRKAIEETANYVPGKQSPYRFFGPTPQPVRIAFGAVSHPGKVRPKNEDHYAVVRRHRTRSVLMTNLPAEALKPTEENAYVMVVADGIGGAAFGDLASMLALQTAWELGERETAWPMNMNEREALELQEKFDAYAQRIHVALLDHRRIEPGTAGMGTTLTAAYPVGTAAFVAHIGDSRAYLFRGGAIHHLTRDHTVARELTDAGMARSDAVKFGHLLTKSLGGEGGTVATDVHHCSLEDGDSLLLCTDGLTDLVNDEEIARTLRPGGEAQDLCEALVGLALDRGGKDNVTVVLARYEIPSTEDSHPA